MKRFIFAVLGLFMSEGVGSIRCGPGFMVNSNYHPGKREFRNL